MLDEEKEELEEANDNNELNEASPTDESSDESSAQPVEVSTPSPMSFIPKLTNFWKKIPPSIQSFILTALPYILIAVAICFAIFFVVTAATGVSEEFFQNISEDVSTFFERTGNWFSGNNFVTDEEAAEQAENKYFEKLQDVYEEFKTKYNVAIDTTLITATLFYGRGMSDYIDDDTIYETEDSQDSNDDNVYDDYTKFYKTARRQIKTLAKYQIVENSTYNACPDEVEPQSKIVPSDDKKVADTWAGFFGWNTRATFNYQDYQYISYPKIDGTAREIKWCPYQEADTQLIDAYKEDYEIYEPYLNAYNSCRTSCLAKNCTIINDSGLVVKDPDPECVPCDVESACASQKEEKEKYYTKLSNNWADVYSLSKNPIFSCSTSDTWGYLANYGTTTYYQNYSFPEEWINLGEEPSFWAELGATLTGKMTYISCSAKPAIRLRYQTEIKREGVYYYKLVSRSANFLGGESFIERYYPEEIDKTNLDQAYEDSLEIVDGIYDLYEYVTDRRFYCKYPSGSSYLTGAGVSYASESREEFIELIANEVVQSMNETGVLASLTIAQAALESTNGTSGLSSKFNNYFGMTVDGVIETSCASGVSRDVTGVAVPPGSNGNNCGSLANAYWDGTVVYMCNASGNDCQYYRVYDGFTNSLKDHDRLLSTPKYSCQGITDAATAVSCVARVGYASDQKYIDKVMGIIDTYDLTTKYDIGAPDPSVVQNNANLVGSGTSEFGLNGWLFVGDSFTDLLDGVSSNGGSSAGGWAEAWTENYASTNGFNIFGYSGYTTAEIYSQLQSGSGLPGSAKGIVVLAGINDIKDGRSISDIKSSMGDIIEILQNKYPNTLIYIQKVFPYADWVVSAGDPGSTDGVNELNSEYEDLISGYSNVYIIDTRSGFLNNTGMIAEKSEDGTHIAPAYYDDWLDNIKSALRAAGAVSSGSSSNLNNVVYTSQEDCIPWVANGVGTMLNSSGFIMRTAFDRSSPEYYTYWKSNNNLFYRSNHDLLNQCTWYAHGRGLEILTSNGMSLERAQQYLDVMHSDAGKWFGENVYFSSSTNYLEPKIGAIIVWSKAGAEGHVAVIENIEYDSAGNITNISTTEGGVSIGGFQTANRSLDYINAHGNYRFVGYVYLLS